MLDFELTKNLNGIPVKSIQLVPGGFLVVDINGNSRIISPERWADLPRWDITAEQMRAKQTARSYESWVIALLGFALAACSGVAIVFTLMNVSVRRLFHLLSRPLMPR